MFLVQKLPWDSPRNILQGKHGFPKFNFFFNFQFDHACSTSNNSSGRTRTAPDIRTGKDDKHGRQMSHFVVGTVESTAHGTDWYQNWLKCVKFGRCTAIDIEWQATKTTMDK